MFNPQDIEEKTFEKAFIGGYKAEDVDDFLDGLAVDYKRMFVENAEIKKKIVILAEKIEEYRKSEETIKTAIIFSQKLKEDSTKEAQNISEKILADTKAEADEIIKEAQDKSKEIYDDADRFVEVTKKTNADLIQRENDALNAIKKEVSDFKTQLQTIYKSHLKVIMSLPNYEEPIKSKENVQIEKEIEQVIEKKEEILEIVEKVEIIEKVENSDDVSNEKINIALNIKEEPDEDEEPIVLSKPISIDFEITPKE